jgi:Fic family protein
MENNSIPPYSITPSIIDLIAEIGENLGILKMSETGKRIVRLRRENNIKSVQASLQIENNSLTLPQVTAVISGKKVLGNPREIHEVLNAHKLYAGMENLNSYDIDDFLQAHKILMEGLVESAGSFRQGSVGITKGDEVLHIAPPAERVVYLMNTLFEWLKKSEEHPLIKSSVFHYEVEFIHPFLDGNGRMGRLWQTLILSKWREIFLYLPVESVIRDRQKYYYDVLARSDNLGDSTVFIEFMLDSILTTIQEIV